VDELTNSEYIRQRAEPRLGDPHYLILSDLLLALNALRPFHCSRVLDYGCGGSPYQSLFGACTYHRADLAGGDSLDFEYDEDSRLPAQLSDYDCIFSSQVLEHVPIPALYLAECYRVLKPEGRLLLSTHGLFEDHACPYDYWRWTAFGLHKMVEDAGFTVERILKVTTGPRAAVFLAERELHRLRFRGCGVYGHVLNSIVRGIRFAGARRRHKMCDTTYPHHRIVDAAESGHDSYIVIALLAHR
jgi:SAM-dependent methyltransferase